MSPIGTLICAVHEVDREVCGVLTSPSDLLVEADIPSGVPHRPRDVEMPLSRTGPGNNLQKLPSET